MKEYEQLMKRAGCEVTAGQVFTNDISKAIKSSPDRVPAMFRSLASGDDESFLKQATALGFSADQARHAVRDTAVLASMIIQAGVDASW